MERFVIIECEARNVAPRFCRASWRVRKVGVTYPTIAEARKRHRLSNCHYSLWQSDSRGVRLIREVDNISNNKPRVLYVSAGVAAVAALAKIFISIYL